MIGDRFRPISVDRHRIGARGGRKVFPGAPVRFLAMRRVGVLGEPESSRPVEMLLPVLLLLLLLVVQGVTGQRSGSEGGDQEGSRDQVGVAQCPDLVPGGVVLGNLVHHHLLVVKAVEYRGKGANRV